MRSYAGLQAAGKSSQPACIFASHMYKILRNFLFLFPAETAHKISMDFLMAACSVSFLRKLMRRIFLPDHKNVQAFGLDFRNPVGLGAGFDKNAKYLRE